MNKKNILLTLIFVLMFSALISQEWINYNTDNTAFPSNPYKVIELDLQGNKWIGTQFKGVYKYDGTNWEIYNTNNSFLPSNQINDLKIDRFNNVWICTANGGLAMLNDNQDWTIYNTNNSSLPVNDINTINFDAFDNKWIGTKNGLVMLDPYDNWYSFNSYNTPMTNNNILSIGVEEIGGHNIKWIGTANSLYKYDDMENVWTKYNTSNSPLTGNTISSIYIDRKKSKWLAVYNSNTNMGGGLIKIDSLNVWTIFNTQNCNIPSNNIYGIDSDRTEAIEPIWLATDNGLAKLSGTSWTVYNTTNTQGQITSNQIFSVKLEGALKWIGTEKMMLRLSGSNWSSYSFLNSGIPNNKITTMLSKKVNNTYVRWIGTSVGLTYFDGDNWTVYHVANSPLPSNNISALALDNQGNLWVGTKPYQNVGGGLAMYNINEGFWLLFNTINSELTSNSITSLFNDKYGNIWVGTEGGGLIKISNQIDFTIYNENNSGISSNSIKDINCDNKDVIWVATDYGLCTLNTTTNNWTVYNKYNTPLPSNIIKRVNFSPNYSQVLIASDAGFIKKQGNYWAVYNTSNSQLPSNIINDVKQDSSGYLWIATDNGLVKTDEVNWQSYNSSNSSLTDNIINMLVLEYQTKNKVTKYLAGDSKGVFVFNGDNAVLDRGLFINVLQHSFLTEQIHIYAFTNRILADSVSFSINNIKVNLEKINQQQWYYQYHLEESAALSMKFRAFGTDIDTTITKNISVNVLNNNNSIAKSFDDKISIEALTKHNQNIMIEEIDHLNYELHYATSDNGVYKIRINQSMTDFLVSVYDGEKWDSYTSHELNNREFNSPKQIKITINETVKPILNISNYPNPFNPITNIYIQVNDHSLNNKVLVNIYNSKGQLVKRLYNNTIQDNIIKLTWNGKNDENVDLSSGIYFYQVQYNGITKSKKMLLLK
ncbi:MAG TPA: two-component regulator propeller domain-containing protein [Candidatus Cloacimonadota bacterium]|nr:two-component regulator propeller domain-containing protein [Candidatus Cloacimonadota bacterium]HQB40229.1 two-component regulator propeller domain-containing protein [Candidatus Cloacimonadota bacterium]